MGRITVEGAAQSEFNGTFSVASVAGSTATYTMKSTATVATATAATGATITAETGPWADHGSGSSRSSRLNMSVGWKSSGAVDYTNEGAQAQHTGSDKTPGKPLDFDLLCPWEGKPSSTCQSDYTLALDTVSGNYVLTTTLPSTAQGAGTGIAMIDGHPRDSIAGLKNAAADLRIPVTTVYQEFGIRDATPDSRRTGVVAQAKCNNCHGGAGSTVSLHGNNRQISATTDVVVCTVCHNSSNSDLAMRPADATTTADDRKKEESIDFKRMIHRIHAGRDTTTGFVEIYGYGGSKNKFEGEFPPGNLLNDCENCHVNGKYQLPLVDGMRGTMIDSGTNLADHSDDLEISPNTSVCSSCHDAPATSVHVQVFGGNFSVKESDIEFY
jgi:OmcA/MtrC family decaheme c-type cytochrome